MTTEQDIVIPTTSAQEPNHQSWKLSLDWWAVISALVLAVIVYIGVQVTW